MRKRSRALVGILLVLLGVAGAIWWVSLRESREHLEVTFLDVGQGDAVFIEAPSGRQVLIDGGRTQRVLRSLAEVMPWYDRSIDLVVATHPDADHIGGLVDVLDRYDVGMVLHSGVRDDGSDQAAFMRALRAEQAEVVTVVRGQRIELGGGAHIEVLFPDRPVPGLEPNTGSVVVRLVYEDTAFMLTGDAPDEIEEYLVALDAAGLTANVLKAGHHGSNTSSSLLFIGYVDPEYAVFSRGCGNSYGHPASEVVARYAAMAVETWDTCADGSVTFMSDGTVVTKR